MLILVIELILVLNLVRAQSSWLGLGAEPSADRTPKIKDPDDPNNPMWRTRESKVHHSRFLIFKTVASLEFYC